MNLIGNDYSGFIPTFWLFFDKFVCFLSLFKIHLICVPKTIFKICG